AVAVGRLAAHDDLRRELGAAGRRVAGRHTWAARARRILTAMDELAGAPPESTALLAGARA
ncbi:MAG: glycosyltransferase family protein, partial [Thermoleophilaceae bacterium]